MFFPDQSDTTPNDCVGREQEIIDFVEQHFVIDRIDKIRFQGETYHIKQFLPDIKQFLPDKKIHHYGILTGLSKPHKQIANGGHYTGAVLDLCYGEFIHKKDITFPPHNEHIQTLYKPHLFEPNVRNLFLKRLFENGFDIYIKPVLCVCTPDTLYNHISYTEKLSDQPICEPKPKKLNYVQMQVYPALENGQSYGKLGFTKETLIPVCKYLIAINLYHNSFRYYTFKNKVETAKLLKERQLEIDDLRSKIELQDYIQVEILQHQEKQDGFIKHFSQRLVDMEQQLKKYVNEKLTKTANFVFELIQGKKSGRGEKIRLFTIE
jgi:hypothetical protein